MKPVRQVFDVTVPWIDSIPTTDIPCLLCGGRESIPLNTFFLNGQRFYTVRCPEDGMMWLNPRPVEDFYHRLYTEYYHLAGPDDPLYEQATLDVHGDEERRRETARLRLDEIERWAPGGRLLEVGFGSEHTLLEAQSRGWEVLGLEISPTCVETARARGIPAECAYLPDFRGKVEPFDVVAMYSMIEHAPDPPAYLRRAHELLRPGGILLLRLPDTPEEGPPASLLAHLYHFNQKTIAELLRRNGFEVLEFGAFFPWRPTRYPGELWSMNVVSRRA